MRLETERLILRPFEPRDRVPCAEMNADAHIMRYFPAPYTPEDTDAMLKRMGDGLATNGFGFLAAEMRETSDFVGIIGLSRFNDELRNAIPGKPEVEVGWRLCQEYWGQGLAPEGALACLAFAWETVDVPEVVAITTWNNRPSQRVMEKIGMRRDPARDFAHPTIAEDNPLRQHVLYAIERPAVAA